MKLRHAIYSIVLVAGVRVAEPCTIVGPISPEAMVGRADAIVRAMKGDVAPDFELPGYIVNEDDFNDVPVPYTFVRPGGRAGSCYANSYRGGAEFLLMLKKRDDGSFTVNWYALHPVNEQLRSADDPWLLWVRKQLAESKEGRDQARSPALSR